MQTGVVVLGLANQQPADVSPPSPVAGRVRVAGQVGLLMVNPVGGHPENRTAF